MNGAYKKEEVTMDLLKQEKDMWNKHFSGIVLEYPDEEVVRFLNRYKNRKETGKLVDLGCGTGRHTVAAAKMGYKVTAVDFVQHCLDVTKERIEAIGKEADYILNNNVDIAIETGSTDVVLAWGCLFHNRKELIMKYLEEINRVLNDDGELYCDFRTQRDDMYCNSKEYGEFIDEKVLLLNKNTGMEGGHIYFPELEELKEMVAEAGFELYNIEQYEFTERNMSKLNSWYHLALRKLKIKK